MVVSMILLRVLGPKVKHKRIIMTLQAGERSTDRADVSKVVPVKRNIVAEVMNIFEFAAQTGTDKRVNIRVV